MALSKWIYPVVRERVSHRRPTVLVLGFLLTLSVVLGVLEQGSALQRPGGGAPESPSAQAVEPAAPTPSHTPPQAPAVPPPEVQAPAVSRPARESAAPHGGKAVAVPHGIPAGPPSTGAAPHAPAHGEATQGEHGPSLPEISPTPGVTFVETMVALMEHELKGRTLGWRPNDIIFGRFTDNINNYQLGVLEALRFTTLRLKDSLTRMGDADTYDPDLEAALNLFMNRATLFWFPSAESSYGDAVDHLKNFVTKLKTGKRSFYYRKDNLVSLLAAYRDLLGNVNKNLIKGDVSWFETDDYFYYAKGVAHVYYEILRVVRVGFHSQLQSTMYALDMMDEVIHELHRAEEMDPWIILDADLDGFFANHRANLNAPLSEVVHLLVILSQL